MSSLRSVAVRRPLRVGIVGFGGIGPDHAAAFSDLASAQVVAVSDLSPQRLGSARSRGGQLRTYCDYKKMLKEVTPDIISICTWPQSHRDVLRDAAEAGVKGVMCEKPLALTSEHLDSMKSICDEYGVKLACGHQYRFHPYFVRAREIVAAGEVGDVKRVRGHIRGSLANNGPHLIDTVRFVLSDAPITEVFAEFDQHQFSMERGLPAEIEASGYIVFRSSIRFEFVTGKIAPSFFEIVIEGTQGAVTVAPDLLEVSGTGSATGHADQAVYRRRQFGEFVEWVRGRRLQYASDETSSAETARAVIGLYDSGRRRRAVEWPVSTIGDVISRAFDMEVPSSVDDRSPDEPRSLWPSDRLLAINGGDRAISDWFSVAPHIGLPEFKGVAKVLRSKQLSSTDGLVVRDFERQFAMSYGSPHAVASTSGTSVIHVVLGALDLLPGDEVITTPVSDMGTLIPILACNLTPVFADIDPVTGNLTAETIAAKITARTKAVILVHLFGRPADLDPICELLRERNISLIEDWRKHIWPNTRGRRSEPLAHLAVLASNSRSRLRAGTEESLWSTRRTTTSGRRSSLTRDGIVQAEDGLTCSSG